MKPSTVLLSAVALCLGSSSAFTAPSGTNPAARSATSLSMSRGDEGGKTFAASALAAAYLLTGVVSADPAFAMDDSPYAASESSFADSSSVVLAGRSGGRAGGRAMPRSRPAAASKTVINKRTTIVAPPVVVGGGYGGYGYGGYGGYYDPTPGIALNLGLGAVNAIGNGMRESRQNQMIYEERAELSASKEREAEMAARIRQLEMMQMQQNGGQAASAQQPQVIIQQPPQAAPAPAQ